MKQLFLIAFSFLFFQIYAQDSSLYDDSYIHEIRISSTDPDFWEHLEDDYQIFYPDVPYRMATVEIDGNILEDVGVRQKGFSSNFFATTNKKPLKLNFGKFVEDREYDGVRKVNLANGVGDPAIVKDKVIYDMYRLHGIPAPRVSHTKIFINDVYWGIYGMIEQIDKRYLKRNFSDNDGNLWKNMGNSDLNWLGTNPNSYSFELQTNETPNDWTKFIEFVDVINNTSAAEFQQELENIFDVDEYLRVIAVDILSNNWDSYIEHGRNWYLYHEPNTDKMHWLPWDHNFAFDKRVNSSGYFDLFLNDPQKVLIHRIFQVPEYRVRYLNYMCEILSVNFTGDRLHPILDTQLDLIDDDWNTANNNFFNLNDLQDFINGNTWNGEPFFGLTLGFKRYIAERIISLQNDIANENYTCEVLAMPVAFNDVVINEFMASNAPGSPWFDQDNEHDDWIELYNNTSADIDLHNYFLSDSPSFIHKWELPDVTIPAQGYLIVWADKDPQQVGLHTKFNLDIDGDEIFLSYIDGTIIDSVAFDAQTENQSLSRIPNGTGDFITAAVTFNAENSTILGLNEFSEVGVSLFPNPADTNLKIRFGNEVANQIIVNDIVGRKIYDENNNLSEVDLDVSHLKVGIYIIRLVSDSYNISKKIIID